MAAAPLSDDGSLGHDWFKWMHAQECKWECSRCLTKMWSRVKPGRGPERWDEMTCEERQMASVMES